MENKETELFDYSKPVKLIRTFISRRRNKYGPAIYPPHSLPQEAYTTYFCEPNISKELSAEPVAKPEPESVTRDSKGNMTIKPNKSSSTEEVTIKAETPKDAEVTKPLNVNEASQVELEGLVGVGKTIAKKVVELREASPFIDYADLNGRVPLPFGGKWSNYELTFLSDN